MRSLMRRHPTGGGRLRGRRWRSVFLEVSLGNHVEALKALQPLLSRWQQDGDVDIATFYVMPDAVEAMIATNALEGAEDLVTSLERGGCPMSIIRGCRRSVPGAEACCWPPRGDLDGAERAAMQAMAEHEGLPAPFERARTQLVLGQLQRRMRRRQAARKTLE